MIDQINFSGFNKVDVAINRLRTYAPDDGYYMAFGGGKDSIVIKALADMAKVKYDAHYARTTVDHPELVQFIKEYHKDVIIENAHYKDGKVATMWNLIPQKKMPPTRMVRYCCDVLKESGGKGRFVITGVRWAESSRRKNSRAGLELNAYAGKDKIILDDPDNPSNEKMAYTCPTKGRHILNPIIDWDDAEVWEFIKTYNIPYCKLYDEGFKRLGCIGCPMSSNAKAELDRYPKFKQAYLRAFGRMLKAREDVGLETKWGTPEEVMDWWLTK